MTISAAMVKDLREKTSAGMMDCKKALQETNGDFEAAVDWLRKKGIAKAEKKAGRVAADGLVTAVSEGTKGAVVEVNAETDFVAKNDQFKEFVNTLANLVLSTGVTDLDELSKTAWPAGGTVAEKLTELVAKIGENMNIRRAQVLEVTSGAVAPYVHMGGKIGVLVAIESADADKAAETAKNVAMHVAAANPQFMDRSSVDQAMIERERQVYTEQAKASGKPDNIVEKIVEGRVNKFCEEICLVDQAFVMDTDRKVGQVVEEAGGTLVGYTRFQLGEGIEKEEGDFAAEVAAAVNG